MTDNAVAWRLSDRVARIGITASRDSRPVERVVGIHAQRSVERLAGPEMTHGARMAAPIPTVARADRLVAERTLDESNELGAGAVGPAFKRHDRGSRFS